MSVVYLRFIHLKLLVVWFLNDTLQKVCCYSWKCCKRKNSYLYIIFPYWKHRNALSYSIMMLSVHHIQIKHTCIYNFTHWHETLNRKFAVKHCFLLWTFRHRLYRFLSVSHTHSHFVLTFFHNLRSRLWLWLF